ncbi:MAG: hypothetical protein JNM72_13625 [Deltaproteobacteria bacterium]|nr:hypothetical protein [Deltaproteobacteria bacterium]
MPEHQLANQTTSQQGEALQQTTAAGPAAASGGAGNAAAQGVMQRKQVIDGIKTWLVTEGAALAALQGAAKVRRIEGILGVVERASAALMAGQPFDLQTLPTAPEGAGAALGAAIAPELIFSVRPLVSALEGPIAQAQEVQGGGGAEGSRYTATEWNTRLGLPEYRTQSDNLAAPEATCNVTSFSMVLERLGVGRAELMQQAEEKVRSSWIDAQVAARKMTRARGAELKADPSLLAAEPSWDPDAAWRAEARKYIDATMNDVGYRRVRGQHSVSAADRDAMAGAFRADAQMEDVLDFLLHKAGVSRTSIMGDAASTLNTLGMGAKAETETLWNGTWADISAKVQAALEAGGGAALSFRHKGTQDRGATHIVAIQAVEGDGFRVDDPYGAVRADYNPRASDDAYWHKELRRVRDPKTGKPVMREGLVTERSVQKNSVNGLNDWGAASARQLEAEESKGASSFISSDIVVKGMQYIQIFNRPKPVNVPLPRPRPAGH